MRAVTNSVTLPFAGVKKRKAGGSGRAPRKRRRGPPSRSRRHGRHDADSPRFYLDEDVPYDAAVVAEGLGLDVLAARHVHDRLPLDDAEHLRAAASDNRIMVTYNRNDFILATRDAFAAGLPHAGLLILTRKLPRTAVRVAHGLRRWVDQRIERGAWPMQAYEIDFSSE